MRQKVCFLCLKFSKCSNLPLKEKRLCWKLAFFASEETVFVLFCNFLLFRSRRRKKCFFDTWNFLHNGFVVDQRYSTGVSRNTGFPFKHLWRFRHAKENFICYILLTHQFTTTLSIITLFKEHYKCNYH